MCQNLWHNWFLPQSWLHGFSYSNGKNKIHHLLASVADLTADLQQIIFQHFVSLKPTCT